jgi:hypothetical protein
MADPQNEVTICGISFNESPLSITGEVIGILTFLYALINYRRLVPRKSLKGPGSMCSRTEGAFPDNTMCRGNVHFLLCGCYIIKVICPVTLIP